MRMARFEFPIASEEPNDRDEAGLPLIGRKPLNGLMLVHPQTVVVMDIPDGVYLFVVSDPSGKSIKLNMDIDTVNAELNRALNGGK